MRILAVLALLAPLFSARADDFTPPQLTGPVVDTAGMLDARGTDLIESYLRRLRDAGGSQVTVATVPDIGDLPIEQASIKIVEAWKLGSGPQDDGVLLLIAAKQRRMRIEVGQGREGVLPDVTASRIVREIISPRMRQGDVNRAVAEGVLAIVSYTDPEFAQREPFGAGQRRHPHREDGRTRAIQILIWMALLFILLKGNRMFGAGVLTGGMMRGPLGGWGGGSDGSWRGGGGSDDSWSGGGGGFSGGGASGEW